MQKMNRELGEKMGEIVIISRLIYQKLNFFFFFFKLVNYISNIKKLIHF